MEDTLRQTLFIEFCGLPGSGKSTVSHIVARWLRADGYQVIEPSFVVDHRKPLRRKLGKLIKGCRWYLCSRKLYAQVATVVRNNGYVGYELFTQTVNVLQKIKVYQKAKHGSVIIWDQGLIQAAVSLSTTNKLSAEENYARLRELITRDVRMVCIFMDIDIHTAMKRMNMRHSNGSRVEKLKNEGEKKKMLQQIGNDLNSLRKSFSIRETDYVTVSTDKLDKTTEDIYQTIKNAIIFKCD